jgi:hypothetical protein
MGSAPQPVGEAGFELRPVAAVVVGVVVELASVVPGAGVRLDGG